MRKSELQSEPYHFLNRTSSHNMQLQLKPKVCGGDLRVGQEISFPMSANILLSFADSLS